MVKRIKLFGIMLLTVLLLAACSGAPAPTSTHAASKAPMKLRLVQSSTSVAYFPLYVAQQEGFYTAENLDMGTPTVLGGDSKVAAALVGGSADLGGGVATTAFLLASAKRNPKIVANLLDAYYVDVIVGSQFKQPPAGSSLKDKILSLKGARIGVPAPSGGGYALLQFLFNKVHMDITKDVTMVNLGGASPAAIGALKTDRVNALVWFQPVSQQVVAGGLGSIFISPARGDIPDMKAQPHGTVITTAKILSKKRNAIAAFVRAVARAEKLIHTDPTKTEELFKSYQPSLDAKTVQALMPVLRKEIPAVPVLTKDGYAKTLHFHQVAGLAKNAPNYATMTDNNFAAKAISAKG